MQQMTPRRLSTHLIESAGQRVRLRGWLHSARLLGKMGFIILRDGAGLAQIVLRDRQKMAQLAPLQPGSVLTAVGTAAPSSHCSFGAELVDAEIAVEIAICEPPPLEHWLPTPSARPETQLDFRALSLRSLQTRAILRVQAEIASAYRAHMQSALGAVEYFGPSLIGGASEGGADSFRVEYFGHTAHLAQSNQLYKQMMLGAFERVFAILPFFRAEHSHTPRHLTEGRQLEFEMGFFDDWSELMDIQEGLIKSIITHLRATCQSQLQVLESPLPSAPPDTPFPRLTLREALQLYFDKCGVDERNSGDLSPAAERFLCAEARESCGVDFLFVTSWPATKRPFYSHPDQSDPHLTNTFDLLGGGSEISSGGQRRHTHSLLERGLQSKGLNPLDFGDYLDAFRYGLPPHGGFGIGLERLTMNLLQLKNIREATPFPSDPKRIASRRCAVNE